VSGKPLQVFLLRDILLTSELAGLLGPQMVWMTKLSHSFDFWQDLPLRQLIAASQQSNPFGSSLLLFFFLLFYLFFFLFFFLFVDCSASDVHGTPYRHELEKRGVAWVHH